MTIEDALRLLSSLLLRGPRDPLRDESHTYRFAASVLKDFGYETSNSPVTGVARTVDECGSDELVVFLSESEAMGLGKRAAARIDDMSKRFGISEIVIGEVLLNGRERPSQGGDSIGRGRPGGKSGTFGCLVKNAPGDPYLLSCSHVVVEQAALLGTGQNDGTSVWQPSYDDGGRQSDNIGTLHNFKQIAFGGFTPNEIDAAIVEPINTYDVKEGVRGVGQLRGTALKIDFREEVKKRVGRRTSQADTTYIKQTTFKVSMV